MKPEGWHCLTETATEEWARLSERGASQPCFYLVAQGIFGLVLDRFGGGRGPEARLFFTLNADLRMDGLLIPGRELRVQIRPIRRTEKVIETGISIWDDFSKSRVAFCHHTGAYINQTTRRIDLLGEMAARLWDEQAEKETSIEMMEPLAIKPQGALHVQTLKGVIEPAWMDRMGHMGIEHYGLILDRAGECALRAMNPPAQPALPRRIQVRYLKEIQVGRPYCVSSWVHEEPGRPVRIEHELWSGTFDSPLELLARSVEESAIRSSN